MDWPQGESRVADALSDEMAVSVFCPDRQGARSGDTKEGVKNTMRSILLVERNQREREILAAGLRREIGCVVLEAGSIEEASQILERQEVSLLLTDLFLPEKGGLDLVGALHQSHPGIATMVGVPEGHRDLALDVLRKGALAYVHTPYDINEVVISAARALRYHDLTSLRQDFSQKIRKDDGFHGILGRSPAMRQLFSIIERVAEDDQSTVLIQGESGTGKELVARAIHRLSARNAKNLVPVNCAAIPEDLLESELFGYLKGAFTGAGQSKMGRIQYADGGTLFLDEIGDMKPSLQAKLLRVIQEKEFEPVGGVKPVSVNVRIIAATHRNLEEAVAAGTFREDLYYRLSVIPVAIPPLRERPEDIEPLVEKFTQVFNRNKRSPIEGFTPQALQALCRYTWPGNVRELENLIQRMCILHGGCRIDLPDLPPKYRAHMADAEPLPSTLVPERKEVWNGDGVDFNNLVSDFEDQLILRALSATNGNKKEAARLLNLKRTTLLEKIKKKGIQEGA